MIEENKIGPNPCHACGGTYGEHAEDCSTKSAPPSFQPDPEPKIVAEVDRMVDSMFVGRKGHGNGPCTYRVMRPDHLRSILQKAYDAGVRAGQKK